jgi:hypothetical protein
MHITEMNPYDRVLNTHNSTLIPDIMKRYSLEELGMLVEIHEIADPIGTYFELMLRHSGQDFYEDLVEVFFCDFEKLPLLINHKGHFIGDIAKWRLKINK